MCKRHKRYFEETEVIGTYPWSKKHWLNGEIDVQRDICLFKARYSYSLKLVFTCDGCSKKINGQWYRCLHCIDFNLCINCYKSAKTTTEHLDSHQFTELRLVKEILSFQRKEFVLFDKQANSGYIKKRFTNFSSFFVLLCFLF